MFRDGGGRARREAGVRAVVRAVALRAGGWGYFRLGFPPAASERDL